MSFERTSRRRLIVIGPVPPPTHGVAVSTLLTLANPVLTERFDVEHLDSTDPRPLSNIGSWDVTNVALGLRNLASLIGQLRGRKGIVYLPVSQNLGGFLRDSLFIHAAASARWRVALHLRGGAFRDFYERSPRPLRWWIRLTLRRVASIAVVGSGLRTIFDGLLPPDRVAVIPNGTPDVSLDNGSRNPGRVLYLSNLVQDKGVVEAVEAALIVTRRDPSAEVVFAGGWDDEGVESALRERVAGERRIKFVPPVSGPEKETLLQSCSVLLFPPSAAEGHPRVVLEAICRGIPIVTTDRGAIAETVTDGESAFVLADPEPERLAERILQLLGDEALRERMGSAARARYEQGFTQEIADRRLADWLSSL